MLILVDIRNTVISREVSSLIKENSQHTKPYARKVAIVGVKGVVRVIADSIGRLTRGTPQTFFDDPEDAMDWLVEPT
ncbi:MAG: STAS/SEC14 domain-containing protein [Anaerolineae bacterium]|nr:STAS/SEC14 domain-containing protein [Anaerolineae bacterium]